MSRKPGKGPSEPTPSTDGLSQEDVATRVPCAQATVSRYDRRGWLTRLANGRLAECAVDEVRARLAESESDDVADPETKRRLDLATMRLREAQAQIRELELERESGKFVELELVQQDAADARERILSVLRAVPQRIAGELDAALDAPPDRRAAVIEKIVQREMERAIGELAEAKYGGSK